MFWVLSSKLSDICIGIDKMCKFEHWKTGLSIISDTEFQTIAKMFFIFFKVGIAGWFPIFSFIIRTWNIRYIDLMLLICRTLTTKVNLCRTKAAISAVSQYNLPRQAGHAPPTEPCPRRQKFFSSVGFSNRWPRSLESDSRPEQLPVVLSGFFEFFALLFTFYGFFSESSKTNIIPNFWFPFPNSYRLR